jgi:Tfp pilus assembly protein PilN
MLRLNLITEETKETIKYRRIFFLLLKAEAVLLVLLVVLGGVIIAAQNILAANISNSSQETAKLINLNSSDYNLKARQLNEQMAIIAQIENDHKPYSPILRNLTALIPDGVSLSFLNINTDTQIIKIRGLALSRDNFLNLEDNLKNAVWFTDVSVPSNSIFSKSNISFDIDIHFDAAKLPPL